VEIYKMETVLRKEKVCVIRESLVALTGDYKKALILGQFIFWSERSQDCDRFMKEEKERSEKAGLNGSLSFPLTYGWIYKKADDLSEETMLGITRQNIMKHVDYLVEKGWMSQRRNPYFKMDRTLQYRVNLLKIKTDLSLLGYGLDGYNVPQNGSNPQCFDTEHCNVSESVKTQETEENRNVLQQHVQSAATAHAVPEITTYIKQPLKNKQKEVIHRSVLDDFPSPCLGSVFSENSIKNSVSKFGCTLYQDEFEEFWKAYPRPTAKKPAYNAYCKAREGHDGWPTATGEELLLGAENFAKWHALKKTDVKYIPFPAKWLTARRWYDRYDTPQMTKKEYQDHINKILDKQTLTMNQYMRINTEMMGEGLEKGMYRE
jgi:hypothetical protein